MKNQVAPNPKGKLGESAGCEAAGPGLGMPGYGSRNAGLMQNHHERLTLPVAEPRGIKISRHFWIPDKVPFSNWGRRPTADMRSPGFLRRKLAISPLHQISGIPKVVFHKSWSCLYCQSDCSVFVELTPTKGSLMYRSFAADHTINAV